jgi:diacylglycerol kinase family enzyme
MKAFIYINSKSGTGYANKYYEQHLKKFISTNFDSFEVIYLPCFNDEYTIKNDDNNENNTIFIVGGDGSVTLTIQNILNCSEFDDLKIPIYICPFGSGNGLAKNLNINPYKLKLDGDKKYIQPMNIEYSSNSSLSFLCQTWGVISDIDINTEFMRGFGDYRFYYGILKSIIMPQYYDGKLNITTTDNKNHIFEGEFNMLCASNGPWISNDFKIAPKADILSNDIDILIIKKKLSFLERVKLIYNIVNETILDLDFVEYFKVNKYELELNNRDSMIVRDGEIVNSDKIIVTNSNKKFLFYSF